MIGQYGKHYTASVLKNATGLTSRQINDWDARGMLPNARTKESGWRKFSIQDIFTIAVCATMKERFNLPLDSMRSLYDVYQESGDNFSFQRAVKNVLSFQLPNILFTDLKTIFLMENPVSLASFFEGGTLSIKGMDSALVLNLGPILQAIITALPFPAALPNDTDGYSFMRQAKERERARDISERELLKLVRDNSLRRVESQLKNGEIQTLVSELSIDPNLSNDEIIQAVKGGGDFETVTFQKRGGKIS